VDVAFIARFPRLIPLDELRAAPELAELAIVKRGNRLSIVPVTPAQWAFIQQLAQ
jgi:predicted RNA-binding protein with PUA-like domain